MRFIREDQYLTGVAVPVSALHSSESCGIGEFSDLVPFSTWCAQAGLAVLQILPVNDTGFESSPYSALSAFALHPVYIRLQSLPCADLAVKEIREMKKESADSPRVNFYETVRKKTALLKRIFAEAIKDRQERDKVLAWAGENGWVITYAVYSLLKEKNGFASWKEWKSMTSPQEGEIDQYWIKHQGEVLYYAWVQYHLEEQFTQAVKTMEKAGVALKGDIPILMNEDSADVWSRRQLFRQEFRAGAPPDFYTDHGQNWGFPVYAWEAHKADGYAWWKSRLKQADKFYHAYRIDHVLGFFRIWATPENEESASMGHYIPYSCVTKSELEKGGFSEPRITWMSKPHIYTYEIKKKLGSSWEEVLPHLERIGIEELFLMKQDLRGSRDIRALGLSKPAEDGMLEWNRNLLFIPLKKDSFSPAWHLRRSRAYESLNHEEKERLERILKTHETKSEQEWEKLGENLLRILKETTEMFVCAEDLGVVPACVPVVLEKLRILGLKICYWAKDYKQPGEPYIPVTAYPYQTVCTLSVHDTGPFREWWQNAKQEDRIDFCRNSLMMNRIPEDPSYTKKTAESILRAVLKTSSRLCILQIQDFLALKSELRPENPEEERINTPGTVNETNWSYKMKPSTDALAADKGLAERICNLIVSSRPEKN
ncbi:MAG: 4-alpha-glucanotransferase [Spirochaetales bacterium]|nr:MAG: 4-alpha-glucanotransferase [Spirochaetales bacterium]